MTPMRCGLIYVPEIRSLLAGVCGTIRWIPGSRNPADPYSRAVFADPPSTPTSILKVGASSIDHLRYIIETPMGTLRFRDFARIKSGRDQYSRIPLSRLKTLVPVYAEAAEALVGGEKSLASCLRWMLRGLPVEKATLKVYIYKIILQYVKIYIY